MQPCSREMQGINTLLNSPGQISLQDLHHHQSQSQIQNQNQPAMHHFESAIGAAHDDFLEQMISNCYWTPDLKSPWDPISANKSDDHSDTNAPFHFDESAILASKLRQHQISSTSPKMLLQQQPLMSRAGDAGIPSLPLSLATAADYERPHNDVVDASSFKAPNQGGGDGSVQALYNGFAGSLHGGGQAPNQPQHFHHPQQQSFGAPMNQAAASGSTGGGGAPAQPRQRVRARRGQATDPHSIAERLRRERIAERMKALQELVPNANKTDKASMLDEIIDYVKFLQLQVKVLSMSRLGGAAAVAPLVADISSEAGGAGGDCVQAAGNGGGGANDSLTVTEHQVAKLMEEDMGSAMQYLQGKGLCLMPISLATAISTSTCHSGRMPAANPILAGEGPSSPSMSVLTVQSATVAADANGKDAASVSKP